MNPTITTKILQNLIDDAVGSLNFGGVGFIGKNRFYRRNRVIDRACNIAISSNKFPFYKKRKFPILADKYRAIHHGVAVGAILCDSELICDKWKLIAELKIRLRGCDFSAMPI